MKKLFKGLIAFLLVFTLASCSVKLEDSTLFSEYTESVDADFSITVNGVTVNKEMMSEYKLYSCEVTTINSYGNEKKDTYIGYRLTDVIRAAKLKGKEIGTITTTTTDEYDTTPYENGVTDCLIALMKNDKVIKAENGPYFAPCASTSTPDYTKNLATITIEGLK